MHLSRQRMCSTTRETQGELWTWDDYDVSGGSPMVTNYHKCCLVGSADVACVGVKGVWEISVPYTQFCCEPKTILKIKLIKNNKNKLMRLWPILKYTFI